MSSKSYAIKEGGGNVIATIDDVEEIADFYTEYLNPKAEDENAVYSNIKAFLLKHIADSVHVSILRMDNEIVSMAILSERIHVPDEDDTGFQTYDGFLNLVYTRADYRGRHLATGCVNEILTLAHNNGYRCVYAEHSDKISDIWKRMGFVDTGKTFVFKEMKEITHV